MAHVYLCNKPARSAHVPQFFFFLEEILLKRILLSERSQSEKATYYMIPTIGHSRKGKTMETVKRLVVSRKWEEGGDYHTRAYCGGGRLGEG